MSCRRDDRSERLRRAHQPLGSCRVLELYDGPLTVKHVAPRLSRYGFFFNYERPHAALAYRTPNEYLVAQEAA